MAPGGYKSQQQHNTKPLTLSQTINSNLFIDKLLRKLMMQTRSATRKLSSNTLSMDRELYENRYYNLCISVINNDTMREKTQKTPPLRRSTRIANKLTNHLRRSSRLAAKNKNN